MAGISVIVPVYNGARHLPALLDAFEAQTQDPAQVEYIIVNNKSRDRTSEIASSYAKTAKINLTCIDENDIQGSYAARNKGIHTSRGEFLLFTDADCVPHPDWIKNIIQGFENPNVGAVAGTILPYPGTTLLEEFAAHAGILSHVHSLNHAYMPFAQTANVAFRRDVFRKTGLFRSGLRTGGDADLNWRMQKTTGYKLIHQENAVILHRHRRSFRDLYEQFERYGRAAVYLDDMHGWKAPRELDFPYSFYQLVTWLFFKYPVLLTKYHAASIPRVEVYLEPLTLYIKLCSAIGTAKARQLERVNDLSIEYLS
ncbi:glycosyltransferase [Beijerinckia indica]|uniref:Glycosyl transferase family 2 n=1 Tax=Beijerinckia indica subsp. indica (strain ATCC 9039 / DSM 1715 / NCIMB 8712) TaxID=395963 RepID=B2IBS2_BEII9|nr:glycosyltransferase [Beijerinckia indica]ACB93794.1 glycosyl transferase family 2 [Beijerinckia indica subsp. indica ATCC 9039]